MSPPMCPPIEMFGTLNVITRFSTIQMPSPLSMMLMPRLRITTAVAPISPKIAPEAPTVGASGSSSSAPNEPASSDTK